MYGTKFKIWGWGGPVGIGAMASIHVGVHGIAKRGNDTLPYTVPSELICANLARAVRLPVPPSLVVANDEGVPFHVSMNFALAGENLPPADPNAIMVHQAELAYGAILFDVWIANPDRHAGNLAFDTITHDLMLFDHSHALFSSQNIDEWLALKTGTLGIGGHCLAAHVTDAKRFASWGARFAQVPEFYIRGLVEDSVNVGLPTDKVLACGDFLMHRRDNLLEILKANTQAFPQVPVNSWADMRQTA